MSSSSTPVAAAATPVVPAILSDEKMASFEPVFKRAECLLNRAVRYVSCNSAVALATTTLSPTTRLYVANSPTSTWSDFFTVRANFAEVALTSFVSTIYNFFAAIVTTFLAGLTCGQVSSFVNAMKKDWTHTGLSASATFFGAVGTLCPTLAVKGSDFMTRKALESFKNDAADLLVEYINSGLTEEEAIAALYANLKDTITLYGQGVARVGLSVSNDVIKFLQSTAETYCDRSVAMAEKGIREAAAASVKKGDLAESDVEEFVTAKLKPVKEENAKDLAKLNGILNAIKALINNDIELDDVDGLVDVAAAAIDHEVRDFVGGTSAKDLDATIARAQQESQKFFAQILAKYGPLFKMREAEQKLATAKSGGDELHIAVRQAKLELAQAEVVVAQAQAQADALDEKRKELEVVQSNARTQAEFDAAKAALKQHDDEAAPFFDALDKAKVAADKASEAVDAARDARRAI